MNLYHSTYCYEVGSTHERISIDIQECLFFGRSPVQQISICQTQALGKILLLDGVLQSSEKDEYRYYESLVQPAMLSHPSPRSALVIGGADGAVAREILRHPSIERLVMVDNDELLIDQCYIHLPEWHQGAFDDPRLELIIDDCRRYVRNVQERFDIIVIDSGDRLVRRDFGRHLISHEFIDDVSKLLTNRGVMTLQAGSVSVGKNDSFVDSLKYIDGLFNYRQPYYTYVPSFWSEWGFIVASDAFDFELLSEADVDLRIKCRHMSSDLKFINGRTIHTMAIFPKDVSSAFDGQLNIHAGSEIVLNNVV
ncbi:MAG: spermidine synthase [Gammaproteobacteria bacterium]|nr:spermidine synthase [Gammaproteobacteria bacterium]